MPRRRVLLRLLPRAQWERSLLLRVRVAIRGSGVLTRILPTGDTLEELILSSLPLALLDELVHEV